MTTTTTRKNYYEIWSLSETGEVRMHGAAAGLTFEDACKHLACESLDFWSHFARGLYRGRKLHESRSEALADQPHESNVAADRPQPASTTAT